MKLSSLSALRSVLTLVLFSVLATVPAAALYIQTGDTVSIGRGTVIDDNLLAVGKKIEVLGTVRGDVIAFGSEVRIDGQVEGNIIAAAAELKLGGSARNAFVGAGDLLFSSRLKNDLLAGCGSTLVDQAAQIGKDAFVGSGNVSIDGQIGRDLRAGAGSLRLGPGARIGGKLDYSADKVEISDRAKVLGAITSYGERGQAAGPAKPFDRFNLTGWLLGLLAIFLTGTLIVVYLPNQVELVTGQMAARCWPSFGWGFLSLVVTPLAVLLLMITVIGIPLGLALLCAYALAIYVSGVFTSVLIGRVILERFGIKELQPLWALLAGLLVINLAGQVPLIGWVVRLVLFLWAFGALVVTRLGTYRLAREKGVL